MTFFAGTKRLGLTTEESIRQKIIAVEPNPSRFMRMILRASSLSLAFFVTCLIAVVGLDASARESTEISAPFWIPANDDDESGADGASLGWLATLSPALAASIQGDRDPDYIAKRREYFDRVFGQTSKASSLTPDSIEPEPSLFGSRGWHFPILPPIQNSYGGNAAAMTKAIGTHPTNHDIVYLGNHGGLAKTVDGGLTWKYLSNSWSSQEINSIAIDPVQPQYVYVSTGDDHSFRIGLRRSFDGGTTWTTLDTTNFAGSLIRGIAIDPNACGSQTATTLYLVNSRADNQTAGLWRSINSGATWSRIRPGSFVGAYTVALDSSSSNPTVYVCEFDGVYKGLFQGRPGPSPVFIKAIGVTRMEAEARSV